MPKKNIKKSDKKIQDNNDDFLKFMEEFFGQLLSISFLIILFRILTTVAAALIFQGSWIIQIQYNFLPVLAFTQEVEQFKVINSFSILFLTIFIFLTFLFKVIKNNTSFAKLLAWYGGVIMACSTLYINFFLSRFDNFGIDFNVQYFIIVLFTITTVLFVIKSTKIVSVQEPEPNSKSNKKPTQKNKKKTSAKKRS